MKRDQFKVMEKSIICSVCNSDRVITDQESGEVICSNCGLVISDNIQDSTDAIYDKSRKIVLRNSFACYDMGFSTLIGSPSKDASGHILDSDMRSRMERLRRWDVRIKT